MVKLISSRLSPFRHQDFRRFFFVQTLSQVGTWSHELARAWIVIEIMGKAGALGMLMLAMALPAFMLILHGGVVVDRSDVRKTMMLTKAILAVSALILAFMVEFTHIQLWHLLVFALIEGAVNAFDQPAYQTLTPRLVPRADFQQALALNSTNFHASRMLGPLIAGVLMAWQGPALVFLVDGLSYLGVILVLRTLKLSHAKRPILDQAEETTSPAAQATPARGIGPNWSALFEGVRYMFSNSSLRYRIVQLLLNISLLFPLLIVVFRVYIQERFDLTAEQFGYLFTFPAMGSMAGAIAFTVVKPKRPIKALILGVPLASIAVFMLPLAQSTSQAGVLMSLTGFALYLSFAALTVSLHLEVLEEFRGRMGSVIGLCFLSIGPLMSFPIGLLADKFTAPVVIQALAVVFFISSALLALGQRDNRPTAKTKGKSGLLSGLIALLSASALMLSVYAPITSMAGPLAITNTLLTGQWQGSGQAVSHIRKRPCSLVEFEFKDNPKTFELISGLYACQDLVAEYPSSVFVKEQGQLYYRGEKVGIFGVSFVELILPREFYRMRLERKGSQLHFVETWDDGKSFLKVSACLEEIPEKSLEKSLEPPQNPAQNHSLDWARNKMEETLCHD